MDTSLKQDNKHLLPVIVFGLLFLCFSTTNFAQVNKCKIKGKTVYTDKTCPDSTAESLDLSETNFSTTPSLAIGTPQNFVATSSSSSPKPTRSSGWLHDKAGYIKALKTSASENRPIFIYGYTDWCGYCKKLHKNIFEDPAVSEMLSRFVKVKINPEHSSSDQNLYAQWGGKGYPTLFIQAASSSSPSRTKAPFIKNNGKWEMINKADFISMLRSRL
jgi:thiol-disulfide isomerase/thioredoxin